MPQQPNLLPEQRSEERSEDDRMSEPSRRTLSPNVTINFPSPPAIPEILVVTHYDFDGRAVSVADFGALLSEHVDFGWDESAIGNPGPDDFPSENP